MEDRFKSRITVGLLDRDRVAKGELYMVYFNKSSWFLDLQENSKNEDNCKNSASKSGRGTSFWYDVWCDHGRLLDVVGDTGPIALGIPLHATVAWAFTRLRGRTHRQEIFNRIEMVTRQLRERNGETNELDIHLWRGDNHVYHPEFTTKKTWKQIRQSHTRVDWWQVVWFKYATPKFSFIQWLACWDRLNTGDRQTRWNTDCDPICSLCGTSLESRNHLFFICDYSAEVWSILVSRLMGHQFSTSWDTLINTIRSANSRVIGFLVRYSFQTTLYMLWGERNKRRHGHQGIPVVVLAKMVERIIRNRISSIIEEGDLRYAEGLGIWIASRES